MEILFFFNFINLRFVNLLETNNLLLPRHCPSNVCWEIFTVCALWKKKKREKKESFSFEQSGKSLRRRRANTRVKAVGPPFSPRRQLFVFGGRANPPADRQSKSLRVFLFFFLFSPDDKKWMTRRNKTWRSRRRRRRRRAAGGCSPVLDTQRGACLPLCVRVCVWFYQLSPKQAKFILCVDAIVGC